MPLSTEAPAADPAALSPKLEARRRAMLEAAGELFRDRGYAATSLADVVKVSGGSLQTLYSLFGSKSGLFQALVMDRCAQVTSYFDQVDLAGLSAEQGLCGLGMRLYRLVMSEEAIDVMRLIVSECKTSPELAQAFWAAGPDHANCRIRSYIDSLRARGAIDFDDGRVATDQFADLIKGDPFMMKLIGLPVDESPEAAERHVGAAVRTFLAAYAPRRP